MIKKYICTPIAIFLIIYHFSSGISASEITPEQFLEVHANQARLSRQWGAKFLGTTGAIWLGSSLFFDGNDAKALQITGLAYTGIAGLAYFNKSDIERQHLKTLDNTSLDKKEIIREFQHNEKVSRYILGTVLALPVLFVPDEAKVSLGALAIPFFVFKTPFENECEEFLSGGTKASVSVRAFVLPSGTGLVMTRKF